MQKVYFKEIRENIIKLISNAKQEVKIAVAWVTDSKIINELEKSQEKGIKITLIFYNDKINKVDFFENLHRLGANVLFSKNLMHNKFCIIDNRIVINGSYNWTYNAKSNDENIVVTFNNYELTDSFLNEFTKLLLKSDSIESLLAYTEKSILAEDLKFTNYYKNNIEGKHSRGIGYPYWYLDEGRLIYIDNIEIEFKYFRRKHFKQVSYKLFGLENRSYLENLNYQKRKKYLDYVATVTETEFKISDLFVLNEVEDLFSSDGVVTLIENFEVVHYQKEIFKEKEKFVSLVDIRRKNIIQQYKLVNIFKINKQPLIHNGKKYTFKEKLYQVSINNENHILTQGFKLKVRTTLKIITAIDFGVLVELDRFFQERRFKVIDESKLYKILPYEDTQDPKAFREQIYSEFKFENNKLTLVEFNTNEVISISL